MPHNNPAFHNGSHGGNAWPPHYSHYGHDGKGGYYRHYNYYPSVVGAVWDPLWWGYAPYYRWYGYPYVDYSYYGYSPTVYTTEPVYVQPTVPVVVQPAAAASPPAPQGVQYLDSAVDAFRAGNYDDALRLASHAAVESPGSAKAHEVMSLALFALKDYRGANMEAHAALTLGPASDWATLYNYYGDLPRYEAQLTALTDHLKAHPDAADARFVLAYHNLMMGHRDDAKMQFDKVLKMVPQDQVAARLFKDLGGVPPTSVAKPPLPQSAVPAVTPNSTAREL